ncbi:MAG: hypothetical protein AAGD04_04795 [Pseudomonadota bacterium]
MQGVYLGALAIVASLGIGAALLLSGDKPAKSEPVATNLSQSSDQPLKPTPEPALQVEARGGDLGDWRVTEGEFLDLRKLTGKRPSTNDGLMYASTLRGLRKLGGQGAYATHFLREAFYQKGSQTMVLWHLGEKAQVADPNVKTSILRLMRNTDVSNALKTLEDTNSALVLELPPLVEGARTFGAYFGDETLAYVHTSGSQADALALLESLTPVTPTKMLPTEGISASRQNMAPGLASPIPSPSNSDITEGQSNATEAPVAKQNVCRQEGARKICRFE